MRFIKKNRVIRARSSMCVAGQSLKDSTDRFTKESETVAGSDSRAGSSSFFDRSVGHSLRKVKTSLSEKSKTSSPRSDSRNNSRRLKCNRAAIIGLRNRTFEISTIETTL